MNLISYLTEHGYDRSINKKILEAPTNKDFFNIAAYLLRGVDTNFEFKGKAEDTLPGILRALGYPATVSKSALSALSVPHRWPQLLAVLTWLVDIAKYNEAVANSEASPDLDSDEGNRMFLEYLTEGYKLWLSGQDGLSSSDQQIEFFFASRNQSLTRQIEALAAANIEAAAQLDELAAGETPLQGARSLNDDLRADKIKFEKHMAKLQDYCEKMTEKVAAQEASNSTREKELFGRRGEVASLKSTIALQKISALEVQQMSEDRTRLESRLAQLKDAKDVLSRQRWAAE